MWLWILLLSNAKFSLQCSWPTVDALFVIDSTATIGANNYVLIKNFLSKVVDNMNIAQWQTHVAIASYTPMNIFLNRQNMSYFQNLRYVPCLSLGIDDCKPAASINSIASHELTISAGDRQQVPDVIIILSSTVRRIPELLSREVLIAPVSPIHAFSITVGALDDFSPTYNYTMLDRLVEPLCTAANAFIQSKLLYYFSSKSNIILVKLMIESFKIYYLYIFNYYLSDDFVKMYQIGFEEDYFGSQNHFYINKKSVAENDQKPKDKENQQPAKESDASTEVCDECRNDEKTDHNQDNQNHDETNQNNANETTNENNNNEYNEEIGDDEGEISEPDSTTAPNYGHLSPNHPALLLPPVDIMLLMDSSSSIGINGFRQVNKFLSDVNIAPGRSRVAVVIFANEPTVYFGFDKYYSYHSVARRIGTIPYIGGPTFLAKALTFAAGVLYQEQNMKDGKHRKHKFMPTPHHDRLQVLIVISDGYSEDNYEKISHILHEKLHVKTAALVMRTYNKERLLPITRYEGAIFLIHQTEALNMWLWRQQRLWNENYADYVQKEKAFMMEQKKKKKL
uniref:VWFA domain-containing protein n=1 Tax=Syphacia muris TaxID=451379 RepID=A0A0N5ALJ9_9BILA